MLFQLRVSTVSSPIFYFGCNNCSQQDVIEFPLLISLSKITQTFLSDTAELEKGEELFRGLIFGGIEWLCIMLASPVAVVLSVSGSSSKAMTAVAFSIQVKTHSSRILLSSWNISQKFNQSLWKYIFMSYKVCFFYIDYFFPKRQLSDA